ncbi:MAG: hypothetical protein IH934_00400 [Nanoarchaeota archaeon]|nr:hypothetical protein [Nanoarchaeota archaeon]
MIFDEFFKQRKRYFSKKPKNNDLELKEKLKGIKKELNGHLDAINENTSEIQTSYECMNEINDKLEKLTERVEAIEIYLQQYSNFNAVEKSFDIKPLTKTEQHVFLVIYALEDEKGLVSYPDIIKKTGLPSYVVSEYIARLVEKGIPLLKKYVNNLSYIKLNPEFKRLQAKENILMIDTAQKELVNF